MAHVGRDRALYGLVQVLKDASADDAHKANAATALKMFASTNDANRAAVVRADALSPLVELLRTGSDQGKTYATAALGTLGVGKPSCGRSNLPWFTWPQHT